MKQRADEDEGGSRDPINEDPLLARLRSQSVTRATPLEPGQSVQAEQNGQWWQASVLQLLEDGRVLIHYVGWEKSWDEAVPRSRLRQHFSHLAPHVFVRCDDGSTFEGELLGREGEFLLLQDAHGATLFINRSKIVVFTSVPQN